MPSLNRTDAFGLVQIEAMMNGKPVCLEFTWNPNSCTTPWYVVKLFRSVTVKNWLMPSFTRSAFIRHIKKTAAIRTFYAPSFIAAEYDRIFSPWNQIKNKKFTNKTKRKDFLRIQIRELPYFRGLRAVEAVFIKTSPLNDLY